MKEKVIISSERYNVKRIAFTLVLTGVVLFVLFSIISIAKEVGEWDRDISTVLEFYFSPFHDSDLFSSIFYFGLGSSFGFERPVMVYMMIFWIGSFSLISGVVYLWLKSYELTITEKRAFGFAAFGRRVDLPIDSITAIGLGWLKSIKITTASGKISFKLIKNRDEMYETISKLIVERQSKEPKPETIIKQETSNADELKKYKDLLDSGVITEEEFEQKKKQLLGL